MKLPAPLARIFAAASTLWPWPGRHARASSFPNTAGIRIDEDSALNYGPVYACVRAIAESLACLPWNVVEHRGARRERRPEHPVDWLVSKVANPETPACIWRETLIAHALLWGNGFAEIVRNGRREPVELWTIEPDRVQPDRTESGALVYDVANARGSNTVLAADDVFHLRGMGYDGLVGYSVVSRARRAIGLGQALEQFGADFFANGASFSGLLKHPGRLTDEQIDKMRAEWVTGDSKAGQRKRVKVLQGGLDYTAIGTPPEDAQFLESRRFSAEEIARWFRVPPHMIGHLDRATFNNIESLAIDFVRYTLLPWKVRLEQEAAMKLIGRQSRGRLEAKLNLTAFLQGDSKSRSEFYRLMREIGVFSVDDILALEDMTALGGDAGAARFVPANWQLLERAVEPPPPPAPNAVLAPDQADGSPPDQASDATAAGSPVDRQAAAAALQVLATDAIGRAARRCWRRSERLNGAGIPGWRADAAAHWRETLAPVAAALERLTGQAGPGAEWSDRLVDRLVPLLEAGRSIEPGEEWIASIAEGYLAEWGVDDVEVRCAVAGSPGA